MIKRICEECGKNFDTYPSSKQKFCSVKCVGKAQGKRQLGKNNANWKGGSRSKMEIKKYNAKYQKNNKERIRKQKQVYRQQNKLDIKVRGKRYREKNEEKLKKYRKWRYNNRPKKNICKICFSPCVDGFCSDKCRRIAQSERQVGKNNPHWKDKIKKVCEECGKKFDVFPYYKNQKYCSNDCKGLSKIGVNNPNWKDGAALFNHKVRDLRENKLWRIAVFERDKYTCVICGKVGGYIEAHHINSFKNILLQNNIKSIRGAKLCRELWDINNGITVCLKCHELIDEDRFGGNQKRKYS